MMRILFLISLIIPVLAFGQKEELTQYCDAMAKEFTGQKPYHLNYTLTVTGKADQPGKESMDFNFYKSGNTCKSVMGTVQEMIQSDRLLIVVNHLEHYMEVGEDTSNALSKNLWLSDWNILLKEAKSVSKKTDQTFSTFTIYFQPDQAYALMRLIFNTRTKAIASVYSEFNPALREPYFSTEIVYHKLDKNWKPEPGFPGVSNYITKKGNRYEAQAAWKSYSFHQNEKGKANW
jgi:hypothetical protein